MSLINRRIFHFLDQVGIKNECSRDKDNCLLFTYIKKDGINNLRNNCYLFR